MYQKRGQKVEQDLTENDLGIRGQPTGRPTWWGFSGPSTGQSLSDRYVDRDIDNINE